VALFTIQNEFRYEIVRKIFEGGMGVVYEAEQLGTRNFVKRVAIKVVRPNYASQKTFIENFIGEAKLAEDHEMSKKQTEAVLGDLVSLITKHLKKGDRIRIGGLGILSVRKRAARIGRNPATGEQIQIKASKKVAFRPAKDLKEAV